MTEEKQERDTPRKVREDFQAEIDALNNKVNQLTAAIVESAHVMGWPKDLLESNGLRAFDKDKDKLSIRK